jgi:hypothetical protein
VGLAEQFTGVTGALVVDYAAVIALSLDTCSLLCTGLRWVFHSIYDIILTKKIVFSAGMDFISSH